MLLSLLAQTHIYGFEGTTAKAIFVAGFTGLFVIAMLVTRLSLRDWLLTGLLLATALAPTVDEVVLRFNPIWVLPVAEHRAELHLGLGLALTVLVLLSGGFQTRFVSVQGTLSLLIALYAGLLQIYHEDVFAGLKSEGFAMATIPCVFLAAGRTARDYQGCVTLLKVMMWVSVAWTFCCSVQFVINPQLMINYSGRFHGMLGNAQHAAAFTAPMAVIALWMLMNDRTRRAKILWLALLAINLLFLGWTGSRTGGLMLVVGLMMVLHARLGKAVLLMPVAFLMLWGLAVLADKLEIGANLARFTSTLNTRDAVWAGQLAAIVENPLLGVGWRNQEVGTENSYLGGFAAYGIGLFVLLVALAGTSLYQTGRFIVAKRWMAPEHRPIVDIFGAFMCMYFAGALFEGYLLARSFAPQVMLMLFAAIGLGIRNEIEYSRSESHDMPTFDDHGSVDLAGTLATDY